MTTTKVQVHRSQQRITKYIDREGQVIYLAYSWDGRPHYSLMHVMKRLRAKSGADTDKVYARWFLAFETFANREKDVSWDDSPELVREAYIAYLRSFGAQVIEKGNRYVIYIDPDDTGAPQDGEQEEVARRLARATLRLQHEALQSIYAKAKKLKLYRHQSNPMSRVGVDKSSQRVRPSYPRAKGEWRRESDPNRIFHLHDDMYMPSLLTDDPQLGDILRTRYEREAFRDRCILEYLLTTGLRVAEACGATLQGWAVPGLNVQPFQTTIMVRNKGDGPKASKASNFVPKTAEMLRTYFAEHRPKSDPLHADFVIWAEKEKVSTIPTPENYYQFLRATKRPTDVPLFYTQTGGRPYNAAAFRQTSWRRAMAVAPARKMRPHQIRHWFVTLVLIKIRIRFQLRPSQENAMRIAFAKDMGWKSGAQMLENYDRALDKAGMGNKWSEIVQQGEAELRDSGIDIATFVGQASDSLLDDYLLSDKLEAVLADIQS